DATMPCDDPPNSFFARRDMRSGRPDTLLERLADRGRIIVYLITGDSAQLPLTDGAVLAIVPRPQAPGIDSVRFTERPPGVYAALLPVGSTPFAALRIGYHRYDGSVIVRRGFADTIAIHLRPAMLCLE